MQKSEVVQPKRFTWGHFLALFLLFFLSLGTIWYFKNPVARKVASGITGDSSIILNSEDGRTNIVFLGIGGEGHSGSDLTDSIILFSYLHSTHKVTLIPIPRDIWVDSMKAKINSAYHYGNEKDPKVGKELIKTAVEEITGLPVHYAVVLDFQGFEKVIDIVGGIDVTVDNSFDDYKYPIPGKETALPESDRYEHLSFTKGVTHMDGALALKFARSRHALGDEGTDFARSRRQEKVIAAFKNKLLSTSTLLSPGTLQSLIGGVKDSLDTDIGDVESGSFIKLFLSYAKNTDAPSSISLESLLYNPKNLAPYAGQWVLIPITNWEGVHAFIAKELESP